MANGSAAMMRKAAQGVCSRQASAEHFEQCAEFLPLSNRGLRPLAVPEVAHGARQKGPPLPLSRPHQ